MAKILFITSRFPYPLTKGDKLRVYFQLKHLAAEHEVHLMAINETRVPDEYPDALSFCSSIHTFILPLHKRIFQLLLSPFKRLPLQVAFFFNNSIQKKTEQLAEEIKPDHIHCHLIRTTEYAKNITGIPKSLDFMDAFGMGMEKRELIERNVLKRILYRYEKQQLYNYERRVFDFIDKFCIISRQDKEWIRSPRAGEISIVSNGVDFESFYPRNDEKKYDLVFMGNLDYPPNVTAILFLCNEIMPLVKQRFPDVRLLIAGAGATKQITALRSDHIDIRSEFNHISDSIAMSRIMIAPMKIHIGLPNKVIQAMAMKTPCIVSTLSNNSIGAQHNSSILEADTVAEFASHIEALLTDKQLAAAIGEGGYNHVKAHFTWEKQNESFNELIRT